MGETQIDQERVRFPAAVYDVYQMFRVQALEKLIELKVEFGSSIPETIELDRKRLRQILVNLVANAIAYTDQGGVTIRCSFLPERHHATLRIDVIDTGSGIPQEEISSLSLPFHQAYVPHRHQRGGAESGLPICSNLAKLMGGTIEVSSQSRIGSTFSLFLHPTSWGRLIHHSKRTINPMPYFSDGHLGDKRILVVDDDPECCLLVGKVLELYSAKVKLAENGEEALILIRAARDENQPFDLVLMDMRMPVLDGYSATRRLREDGDETPILALTASASLREQANCFIAGCSSYLCKPVDGSTLVMALSELI